MKGLPAWAAHDEGNTAYRFMAGHTHIAQFSGFEFDR